MQNHGSGQPNQFSTRDPISTASGELKAGPFLDLSLGGPLPLVLRRSYGSFLFENANAGSPGFGWTTNFDPYLASDGNIFIVVLESGGRVTFLPNGAGFRLAFPARMAYQMVRGGPGFRFLDPSRRLIYNFDNNGHLVKIEDRSGNALTLTRGSFGPTQITDGLGRSLTLTYTASGFLNRVADQTGRAVSYQQTGPALTRFTDANGHITAYAYTQYNELTAATLPRGNVPVTQSYDTLFRVKDQTDSAGNKTTLSYVAGGKPGVTTVTDPLGQATTATYANLIDLSAMVDAAGNSSSVLYDAARRPTTFTDRTGNKVSMAYDAASGFPASITDALGKTTSIAWQSQVQGDFTFYNLAKIGYPDGASLAFTYDAAGRPLQATGPDGKSTQYTYNSRGQVLTVTNPAGGITTLTYNNDGTPATSKLPSGDVTAFTYDNLKRLSGVQFADKTSIALTRDVLDQVLSIADEAGAVTRFAYDANNNPQSVTDSAGHATTAAYDTDDLVSSFTDRLGNKTAYRRDWSGAVAAVTNGAGETTAFTYDKLERLQAVSDPSGKGPAFTYDAEGRLTGLKDALGNAASIQVDGNGRPVHVTSPLGEGSSISYDAMGRPVTTQDALGQQTAFTYESRGLLSGVTAPGGVAGVFTYGDLPLLNSVRDPNGSAWTITRDTLGRITTASDPLGQQISYSYDQRSRMSSSASAVGSVQLTYDAAGYVTKTQFSDGTALNYTYDGLHRRTGGSGFSINYDAGRIVASNGLAIARDPAGRIASISYAPGRTVNYTYDSRGLLAGVSDWAGGSVKFTSDAAHRLVSAVRANGVATQYTYDNNGRLASMTDVQSGNTLASIALSRDAIGRVTAAARNLPQEAAPPAPVTASYAYDAASQLADASYDGLGRLVNDNAGSAYQWSLGSRLLAYARADGSASFTYDALGQRTGRTDGAGNSVNYIVNYALRLPSVATVQSGGSDVRYYIYTPRGSLLYSIEAGSGAHRYYSFDDTGSTTLLTDDAGNVTDTYGVSPYGDVVTAGAGNSTDNPFTWQGQSGVMQELGTSLYYARFRYYDSATTRFLSRDPLFSAAPRQIDPYAYAAGDPVSNVDPMGLKVNFPSLWDFVDESGQVDPNSDPLWLRLSPEPNGYVISLAPPAGTGNAELAREYAYIAPAGLDPSQDPGAFLPRGQYEPLMDTPVSTPWAPSQIDLAPVPTPRDPFRMNLVIDMTGRDCAEPRPPFQLPDKSFEYHAGTNGKPGACRRR